MGYLTAQDERRAHLRTENGRTECGAMPLSLPGARPLLLTDDYRNVRCESCKRIIIRRAAEDIERQTTPSEEGNE